ncbi:electron transport complex subunit RsxD [Conservatibacter flavescens]|uniref:Ion-translocating oxidoreductase complex subunit D n=1 Tax=Conservatibacter flavescens TaxID=28161 RepID=A0A2M8S019_9PAST|nr:electron transport complex subunit RsxD [Conservatibacter flavescens]PJG84475.1 electron transport complex subunit RsxD [Conservatibacter flavescens]
MFRMISSPHTHSGKLTAQVMLWVVFAMCPAILVQWFYFGYGSLIQILLAVGFAIFLEWCVTLLRKKTTMFYLSDFSVVVTALILAVAIPPYAPYWVILIGTFCAVILGKHVYGGLGQNLFNPAMIGYVVLLIAFPLQMTTWLPPLSLLHEPPSFTDSLYLIFQNHTTDGFSLLQLVNSIDGITQATPLDAAKTGLKNTALTHVTATPIFTPFGGLGWWQVNLAFLLGGIFLIWKKVIHWQIPVAMLSAFGLLATITWIIAPEQFLSPWTHLFSGAMMIGAFFIATDPVTASITIKGKIVFGILVGSLVYIIRFYGNYPDGIAFAILLSNIGVPLIDHYTRPRVYGR